MAKKSKRKAPSKAKAAKAPAKPVPEKEQMSAPPPPPRVSQRPTTRKSSVIMLSSAENSFSSEPSLVLNEQSISIIDLARPSTRMSNVEMDMTDVSDPRFSARPMGGDDTDLSLTNIVQTPGVHRERPKSSWVIRRTRSKSVAPPQEDNSEGRPSRSRTTRSGEFSTVTRRVRSGRPLAGLMERIDEDAVGVAVTVTRRLKAGKKKPETSPQAKRNSERIEAVTPAISRVTTRRRNVTKNKVDEEISALQEVQQSLTVSTRRRQKKNAPEEIHSSSEKEPSSSSQTENDSNRSRETTTMSMVSVRRRRAIERPPSPPEEPAAMPTPAPTVRPRTRSVSRGRQPVPTTVPESATRPKRIIKKVSKCPCCVNGDSHHGEAPLPTRGRSRTRTTSEVAPPRTRSRSKTREPKGGRTRSKSVIREPAPKTPPTRSKSVSREPAIHVPVYRQLAPIEPPAVLAAKAQSMESDVYAFDSPGLLGMEAESDKEGGNRKRKGSTVKKRPRVVNVSSRGKPTTSAKKNPLAAAIFGTDMKLIKRVVKKIGGGPVKQPAVKLVTNLRPASPVVSNYDPIDDHHDYVEDDVPVNDEDLENLPPVVVPPSPPPPPPPVNKVNPLIERVLQQRLEPPTPDHSPAQPNVTLTFSPLGASSPWRIQNENVLPRTFYFSRSKDLLPSYESDVVIRDENVRPKTPVVEPEPVPQNPSPAKRPSPTVEASVPINGAKADAMFRGIQQSYEQLKVTSEMSNKLITAMRKYKANVHNQSVASVSASGELPEDERLISKFREYEANMKKTYQKLKQWYERSQQQLTHSIKTIEQVSAVPKTLAQRQVLDNFRRDSKVFLTMINELESAMNDSNVENVSPSVAPPDKPAFKDVVILTERNMANRNRSPLKTLEIANIPARFSPIKSPLARSAFSVFPSKTLSKPAAAPTIEIADTFVEPAPIVIDQPENQPKEDLFGFETDDAEESIDPPPTSVTPIKITKKTLKERLESVRKMLPSRPPVAPLATTRQRLPKVIGSPRVGKPRSVQSVFASSTPVPQKRTQTRRGAEPDDVNLSAIADEPVAAPSPPVALFDDVASSSLTAVNRTYSRVPRRNHKRKRNVYLADLGLSDDEEDESAPEQEGDEDAIEEVEEVGGASRQVKKKRRVAASKKKNVVEETNEFKQFVNEFNSMCEEVDRYKLVIEKPTVRQRV